MRIDDFHNEMRHELVMHQVRRMLNAGLISLNEFRDIEKHFNAKYNPITGGLLVETDLLCVPERVINGRGKEGSGNEKSQSH